MRLLHAAISSGFAPATASILVALSSCQHEADGPGPCQAAVANPLTFSFLEYSGTPTPDTTYNNQSVSFVGPGAPYTAYQWLVGPTTVRATQKFTLSFDANTVGPIPVRLIARRPPNTACFPHDDGVDTLTRVLTLVPFVDPAVPLRNPRAPIYGKYLGATHSAPRDTFTVRIYQGRNYYYPTDPTAPPHRLRQQLAQGVPASLFR